MTNRWMGTIALAGIFALTVTACDDEPKDDEGPAATGADVWTHLQQERYQQTWQTWPGKGRLYQGTEPHGMLLTTYLNESAYQALTGKTGSMPPGAIIVKENYMPDGTLDAITTMYKVRGYNPAHNDWFWVKHFPDGSVDVEGRVEGCQNCHNVQADNDYVYTGALK